MIYKIAQELSDQLINIRRYLHSIPELSDEEYITSDYISKTLNELGIENSKMINTGVVATIKGKNEGKTILVRADIDALPIEEKNDVYYKSKNKGVMHACGHDAHITCALGMCMILKKLDYEFCGNVKVVFQPAEEASGGALRMIENGVMDTPDVNAAIALHVEPLCSVGTLQYRNHAIMASPDDFKIIINGIGGHGACPENCVNPIYVASELTLALQNIVSENFEDISSCIVSVCTINGGTLNNIIPDTVEITGTARSLDYKTRNEIERLLEEYTKKICNKNNCKYIYKFNRLYPPVINSKEMNDLLIKASKKISGIDNIIELKKSSMTGDDFSYFAELVPSAYFKLGAGNKKINKPLHNPDFDIDEKCLPIGAAILTQIALDYLKG